MSNNSLKSKKKILHTAKLVARLSVTNCLQYAVVYMMVILLSDVLYVGMCLYL